ncbi:formyltransferase family protein [Campylobacter lari]|uniref:formyltransferase family protein n=1 Tax=Campylobacter lari TaxID=201 RepID=UPI002012DD9C|nr:formyltransferase family protein [Campylobacter lari]
MNFNQIIIIGKGKVAINCHKIICDIFSSKKIFFYNSDFKDDEFFNRISNSLIISANNAYIFKEKCIQNNIIINYHNSLLPKYKGRNAHIWAIWNQENTTGITWHKVDCTIDTGDIILQKEITINNSLTAIKLLQIQQNLAINSFKECLANMKKSYPQPKINSISTGGGDL